MLHCAALQLTCSSVLCMLCRAVLVTSMLLVQLPAGKTRTSCSCCPLVLHTPLQMVRVLVSAGADLNKAKTKGSPLTPIANAAILGKVDILQCLLGG